MTTSSIKRWYYLKRMLTEEKSHLIIPFKKDVVHIGRSKDATYIIPDPLISRSHALFSRNDQQWTVKNLSTNGLYVNKIPLSRDEEKLLDIGHTVQLGHSDKFFFRFGMKERSLQNDSHPICLSKSQKDLVSQEVNLEERLLKSEKLRESLLQEKEQMLHSMQNEQQILQERFMEEYRELERKLNQGIIEKQSVVEEKESLAKRLNDQVNELKKRLEEEKLSLERKLHQEEEKKRKFLEEKESLALCLEIEKESLEKRLLQERLAHENALATERQLLQGKLLTLEEQRRQLELEVRHQEENIKVKEEEQKHLKEEQSKQAETLLKEKEELLCRLKEVEIDLEEKALITSTLEGELQEKLEVNRKLEALMVDKQAIEDKLKEAMEKGAQVSHLQEALSLMEAQKISLQQEVAFAESGSEAVRKQVIDNVTDIVENEFQCPICNELFCTAIMLNCSHTFCQFCINTWKKTKKECPNCRQSIQSETRSLVVDSFIDKIVETLSDELKEQRKQMIAERTAAVNAAAEAAAASTSASTGQQQGRRRRRGRSSRNRSQEGALQIQGGVESGGGGQDSSPIRVISIRTGPSTNRSEGTTQPQPHPSRNPNIVFYRSHPPSTNIGPIRYPAPPPLVTPHFTAMNSALMSHRSQFVNPGQGLLPPPTSRVELLLGRRGLYSFGFSSGRSQYINPPLPTHRRN